MQLPPDDEIVMVSSHPPARAKKLRYYDDANFTGRVVSPPALAPGGYIDRPAARADDWSGLAPIGAAIPSEPVTSGGETEGGPRREPELEIAAVRPAREADPSESRWLDDDLDEVSVHRFAEPDPRLQRTARLAALDPDDGIAL